MVKELYNAELNPRSAKTDHGGKAWWYVDRSYCTFHHNNGTAILIPTYRIKRALALLDRQIAQEEQR